MTAYQSVNSNGVIKKRVSMQQHIQKSKPYVIIVLKIAKCHTSATLQIPWSSDFSPITEKGLAT